MDIFLQYKADIALLFMRIILGILFLMQGYDKVFGLGLKKTEEGIEFAMRGKKLPGSIIKTVTVISSFVELFGGIMLIAGFMIYPALVCLGIDLVVVVFAMSLRESLWDMRFVWPRLILLLAILLLPSAYDRFSFDHLFSFL
ncbi:MAG: DoxX family protein [Bacteroidota bacterium]|nr:DoxX family protein [Bacteroidota bacterium]